MTREQTEFLYSLHDTLILLGAPQDIAILAANSSVVTDDDIQSLKRLNISLINQHKKRLCNVHLIGVRVVKKDGES